MIEIPLAWLIVVFVVGFLLGAVLVAQVARHTERKLMAERQEIWWQYAAVRNELIRQDAAKPYDPTKENVR